LLLKATTGSKACSLAFIGDQNFAPQEAARVRLEGGNQLVRCVEIRARFVLVRLEETGVTEELKLPEVAGR
jgi:hypothetical protein